MEQSAGIRHVVYRTISAILYLLDFASNIYVLIQFYEIRYKGKDLDNIQIDQGILEGLSPTNEHWAPLPFFQLMLSLMVIGHVGVFFFFLVEGLRLEERPLQARRLICRALGWYILPVAQFRRALQGLTSTLKRRPVKVNGGASSRRPTAKDEARVEALYGIASATTDGGPLFLLQYLALTMGSCGFSNEHYKWKPGHVLLLSLCLSALSATWNVTRAVSFLLGSSSKLLALAAGAFTLSALTVRCTSLVSIVELQIVLDGTKFFVVLGTYCALFSIVPIVGYWLLYREYTSEVNWSALSKSALRAAEFAWVSISFGPLYPFARVAETCTTMGLVGVSTKRFQARFCFYATCRWILEAALMSTLLVKKWSLCNHNDFHNHSALQQSGYLIAPMMPCHLYISALAIGLSIGILSQVLFQIHVQTEIISTFQTDHPENELKLAASGAYEAGMIGMDVIGII